MKAETNMEYVFLLTGRCVNSCIICCDKSKPNEKYYHTGQNFRERLGLENIFRSFSGNDITMSGGDPLMNLDSLELFTEVFEGESSIIFNPLSIVFLHSGIAPYRLTRKNMDNIMQDIKKNGFNEKSQRALDIVKRIDTVGASLGKFQAPKKFLSEYMYDLFNNFIEPALDETVSSFITVGCDSIESATCAFSFQDKKALLPFIDISRNPQKKTFSCSTLGAPTFYFLKENDGARLYINPCCSAMMTTYVSYKTPFLLDDFAVMKPSDITDAIGEEIDKMDKSTWLEMLHSTLFEFPLFGERTKEEGAFDKYIALAEKKLYDDCGKKISIPLVTPTFSGQVQACELCNAVSTLLYQNNITPNKWHAYLEEHYEV